MATYLKWAAVIFVVWYLITNPVGAANAVNHAFSALGGAGTAFGRFLNGLHT